MAMGGAGGAEQGARLERTEMREVLASLLYVEPRRVYTYLKCVVGRPSGASGLAPFSILGPSFGC